MGGYPECPIEAEKDAIALRTAAEAILAGRVQRPMHAGGRVRMRACTHALRTGAETILATVSKCEDIATHSYLASSSQKILGTQISAAMPGSYFMVMVAALLNLRPDGRKSLIDPMI